MIDTPMMAIIAGCTAGILLALFVIVRNLIEAKRERERRLQLHPDSLESFYALRVADENAPPPNAIDRYFGGMVEFTGLNMTAAQVVGLMGVAGVSLGALLYLWQGDEVTAAIGVPIGMLAGHVFFRVMRGQFRQKLQNQLPDALFFLARSLRAGLSFEQALDHVARESPLPLADELRRANEYIKLGIAAPAALQMVAPRLGLPDFNAFAAVIALHRSIGGNLTLLLDRLATSVRDRNQYLGFFRSATAMGRVSAVAIGSAVPLIFLGYLIFEPDYAMRFFESTNGLALFATAAVLEVIGGLWIYFLLRSDY